MRVMHNVFFALKDKSPASVKKLLDACHQYLTGQKGIVSFAFGAIAPDLARAVNVLDRDVGAHILFADKAAHDAYQDDALHHQFVNENKPGWATVRVFDSNV